MGTHYACIGACVCAHWCTRTPSVKAGTKHLLKGRENDWRLLIPTLACHWPCSAELLILTLACGWPCFHLLFHVWHWPGYWLCSCFPISNLACLLIMSLYWWLPELALVGLLHNLHITVSKVHLMAATLHHCRPTDCQTRFFLVLPGVLQHCWLWSWHFSYLLVGPPAPVLLFALYSCLHIQGCSDQRHKWCPLVTLASNQGMCHWPLKFG